MGRPSADGTHNEGRDILTTTYTEVDSMGIYKKVVYENSDPWQSYLPECDCACSRPARIILHENIIFCGQCGKAYGKAGSVGLVLVKEEQS